MACHQRKLFNKFTQAESSISRAYGGTGLGLGLTIVKQLIDLMVGQLQLQSAVNKGSEFKVYPYHLKMRVSAF